MCIYALTAFKRLNFLATNIKVYFAIVVANCKLGHIDDSAKLHQQFFTYGFGNVCKQVLSPSLRERLGNEANKDNTISADPTLLVKKTLV